MKKFLNILLILCVLCFCKQTVNAVLTKSAPTKHKTTNESSISKIKLSPSQNVAKNDEVEIYKKRVSEMIDTKVAEWRPVVSDTDLNTIVEFGIAENGRINYSEIIKSSGTLWYDYAARNTAVTIKYDPLPASFRGTCSHRERQIYPGNCMIITHSFSHKANIKKDYEKTNDEHINDMQKSADGIFEKLW